MAMRSALSEPSRLLLVLPSAELVAKALRLGMAVWVIDDPRRHDADLLRAAGERVELIPVEGRHLPTLAAEVAGRHGIGHVLPAQYGADGRSARLLADTEAMRRLLNENGHPVVRSRPAGSIAEVTALTRRFGFPVMVRAPDAPATVLRDHGALRRWASTDPPTPWLVEEFLAGPRYVVSTLTVDGMHQIVGITERCAGTDGLAAGGYLHPATVSDGEHAALTATVTGLLDLADYEFGPAQTTVVVSEDGPRVLTSGTSSGCPRISRLIELASGFDPEAGLLAALTGETVAPPITNRYAGLCFVPLPADVLATVSGSDEVRALPGVDELCLPFEPGTLEPGTSQPDTSQPGIFQPGEQVPPGARGFVVASGESRAEVVGCLREAVRLLTVRVSPG